MKRIFFILLFLYTVQGYCQQYEAYTINYGVNEGLPSSECYEIIQDSKGYIWFGTDRGVVRYNGYEFKTFTTKEGLNNNVVFYLAEGSDGKIWFYDIENQLSYFHNDNISLYKFNHILNNKIDKLTKPIGFSIDENETVYFSVSNTNSEKEILKSIDKDGNLEFYDSKSCEILFEQKNNIAIGYFGYHKPNETKKVPSRPNKYYKICHSIDNSDRELVLELEKPFYVSVPRFIVYKDKLYFAHFNQLFLIEKGSPIKKVYEFNKGIIELEVDQNGNLYVGLYDEGLIVIPEGDSSQLYTLISNCSASGLTIDNNGAIWITTQDNGIYYIPQPSFKQHMASKNELVNNISGNTNSIIYSLYSGEMFELKSDKKLKLGLPYPSYVRNIIPIGKNGFISSLISTYSYYYKSIDDAPILINGASFDWCKTDSTVYGIFNGRLTNFNLQSLKPTNIRQIYEYKLNCISNGFNNNVLFFGTNSGLYRYQNESFEKAFPEDPIYNARISDLVTKNKSLYTATRGDGIIIKPYNKKPIVLSKKDGLISNEIHKIHVFKDMIYVLSKEGMSTVNLSGKKPKITNYTSKNGLASNEINDLFIRNDTIWLATNKGITKFNQKEVLINTFNSPVYLTSFKIRNKEVDIKTKRTFKYNENDLEISFEAISFISRGNIKYRYKLIGLDNSWKETMSRNLRLPNLPPGKYKFLISYQNPDLSWSPSSTLFEFAISKPIWEELWFVVLLIGTVAILIFLVVRQFILRANRKVEIQRKIVDLERRALQAQMNPHFIFNALTSIQSLIAQNKNENAEEFLVTFSRLVRASLNQSSQAFISLQEEIELLNNYMKIEGLRFEKVFEWDIHLSNEIVQTDIAIPPMIIQPFVENAIEHGIRPLGKKGYLSIEITEIKDGLLEIKIDDDGVGRKRSKKKKIKGRESKGINLVKDRLFLLNKNSKVQIIDKQDNNMDCGTLVVLNVPFQRD